MNGYPLYENLEAFSWKYHFFHSIHEKENCVPCLRTILEISIAIIIYCKILILPIMISRFPPSALTTIFTKITWEALSLEIIGEKLVNFATFSFSLVFSILFLIYYKKRDLLYIHHTNGPFCFIL